MAIRPYLENAKVKKQIPEGWIYFVSAEADRKAVENSKWSNGAFTYCLIKDRKSTRLNSSHIPLSRMPSSA